MPDIELTIAPTEIVVDISNDFLWINDVSEIPDAINKITPLTLLGQNLVDIRSLSDPGADRLLFWDDSAGAYTHLTLGTNLSITGTTINAASGLSGLGSTDNAILRADGTGGSTAQGSGAIIDDSGHIGVAGGGVGNPAIYATGSPTVGWTLTSTYTTFYAGADIFGVSASEVQLGGGSPFNWGSGGSAFQAAPDTGLKRTAAGIVGITNGSTGGGSLSFIEITAPSAPAANGCYLYVEDNGSGKTRLMALFSSGAAQQVAIQP